MTGWPTVLVSRQADGSFAVKVRDGKAETGHVVSVPIGLEADLGLRDTTGEELVRASFAFLLDREPATSILPKFSLDVIPAISPSTRENSATISNPRLGRGGAICPPAVRPGWPAFSYR